MHKRVPEPIEKILNDVLTHYNLKNKTEQYEAVEVWEEIVGEQIAKISDAEKVEDGVLFVSVTNAPWRAELSFRKKDILKKIEAKIGKDKIKSIRFK